jgi:hypothetical protein
MIMVQFLPEVAIVPYILIVVVEFAGWQSLYRMTVIVQDKDS